MKKIIFYLDFILAIFVLINSSIAQTVNITGKVINPDEKPIHKVLIYLANNPGLLCYSDSLGNFSLSDQINTTVTELMQDRIISFENQRLILNAENNAISVDIFTIDGRQVMNIVNLSKCHGTIELFPEAYISDLPQAMYIVRARVGNTIQAFKILNIVPSSLPEGITQYDIDNTPDKSLSGFKFKSMSGVLDTLVLVHDFYKSRKLPLDSFSMHYDTIHLNNFADYSIAEDFEPSVTYSYSGYANFTEILSADSVQYIIDYDTLSILDANQKIITIPIDNIENLDNSIEFISGLHFEPSGTKFLQPVQVTVLMKDSIPEDFLVFHCNDQGEINFIPYISYGLTTSGYCIVFNINHFSSVGIGTGEIPTTDPAELTTTDQFVSYWAKCVANDVEITEEFFETWYTNVIVPMINNISTVDQLKGALSEFMQIHRKFDLMGPGGLFSEISFYDQAMGMFSAKMMNIWNELINLYDIKDNCLKRELLEIAAKLVRLGDLISGLCQLDLDDFGDGEFYNLATKIEFAKPIKYMKINESYIVEYTLKCISGNPLPEKITWSSSKSSVATINSEGKIVALSEGVTTIKGKFCDIENTFKVEVEGFNCEENYCNSIYQPDHPCFDGTYICTGALPKHDLWWPVGCTYSEVTDRITVLIDLTSGGYFKSTWTNEGAIYDLVEECIPYYNIIPNTMFHYEYYLKPWLSFGMNCEGVNKLSFHLGDMQGGYYNFTQVVYDDHLMFDLIRYLSTPTYSVYTTRLFCTLIDE